MSDNRENIENVRYKVLLCELGVLLHELGKVSQQFYYYQLHDNNCSDFEYEHIIGIAYEDIKNRIFAVADLNDCQTYKKAKKMIDENEPDKLKRDFDVLDHETKEILKRKFIELPSPFDNGITYRLGDFIEYLGQGEKGLYAEKEEKIKESYAYKIFDDRYPYILHLLNSTHGYASGMDKRGDDESSSLKAEKDGPISIATPFGYEKSIKSIINALSSFQIEKKCKDCKIREYTRCGSISSLVDVVEPIRKCAECVIKGCNFEPEDDFIKEYRDVKNKLKLLFSLVPADTRKPINDVTVWDTACVAASMFKAIMWDCIVDNNIDKIFDENVKVSVLSLRLNWSEIISNISDIPTILALKDEFTDKLDYYKEVIEYKLAVGNEIYRDENGAIYIIPTSDCIKNMIDEKLNPHLSFEGRNINKNYEDVFVSQKKTKDPRYIGRVVLDIIAATQEINYNRSFFDEKWGKDSKNSGYEICPVCGVRPLKNKNKANICDDCYNRTRGENSRSKKWLKNLDGTVWIDEVGDRNGRAAVVSSSFDLDEYIRNGLIYLADSKEYMKNKKCFRISFVDKTAIPKTGFYKLMYRAKEVDTVIYIDEQIPLIIINNKNDKITSGKFNYEGQKYNIMDINRVGNAGYLIKLKDELPQDMGFIKAYGVNFKIQSKTEMIADKEDAANKVKELFLYTLYGSEKGFDFFVVDEMNKEEDICDNILTRSTSFARYRRIWETTKEFYNDVLIRGDIQKRRGRLCICNITNQDGKLVDGVAYEIPLTQKVKIHVVYDKEKCRLIMIDNPYYIASLIDPNKIDKQDDPLEYLKEYVMNIKEPLNVNLSAEYGHKSTNIAQINKATVAIDETEYTPAIPIIAEPQNFMAVIPAENAYAFAKAIYEKYISEVGLVKNRLPFHINIIYFQKNTPIRTAIDASIRAMEKSDTRLSLPVIQIIDRDMQVQSGNSTQFDKIIQLEKCYKINVCEANPNNKYYTFIEIDENKISPDFNKIYIYNDSVSDEVHYFVHPEELRRGDYVKINPSFYDYEWLSTGNRRFEVIYKNGKRINNDLKPQLIDNIDEMDYIWKIFKGLSKSQIYQLNETLSMWRGKLKDGEENSSDVITFYIRSAILNTDGLEDLTNEDIAKLVNCFKNGIFDAAFEIFIKILKRKE